MSKVTIGPELSIYPMPTLLIGANVNDKPNFMALAWAGAANGDPPIISMSLRHNRHTYLGIKQNWTFSVNIPSRDLIKETDYCGIISGSKVNKAEVCRFKVFYGKLNSAPLIEQCPVNLECKVVHILDLGSHALVIGEIKETHVSENCLTDGKPDVNKIKPLIFTRSPIPHYQAFGEVLGKAFSIGREIEEKK